jgi:dephospho-CoA kinase
MILKVGITGSLCTGKSTVASMFGELGAHVFDADKMAHDLMKKGQPCYDPIINLFGKEVLDNGELDRKKIAAIVFKDKARLNQLEKIIHPEVIKLIRAYIEQYKKKDEQNRCVLVFDVPLLFESQLDALMDFRIVVNARQETQLFRSAQNLGMSSEEALGRIRAQMPLREKIKKADIIIDNDKDKIQTKKQVEEIWQKIHQIMEKK